MLLLCFRGRCPASCKCCPAGPARWSRCIHFRGGLLLGNACFHTLGIKTLATKARLVGWLHVRNSNTNTLCAPSFYTIFSKIANYDSPPKWEAPIKSAISLSRFVSETASLYFMLNPYSSRCAIAYGSVTSSAARSRSISASR